MKMKDTIKRTAKKLFYSAPKELRANFMGFEDSQLTQLSKSIESNYLDRGETKKKLSQWEYEQALHGQLFERLDYNRNRIVPWLNSIKNLKGSRILEIGCGTGISTLALAEQGALVTGIDVDQGALNVAKDRLEMAGLKADIVFANGSEIDKFKERPFDFIIYYAVLEHMTVPERIESLSKAWAMLPENGLLAIIETPNRLWYYDSHTAAMPFYDWLPDELAYYYSKFSPRKNFNDQYRTVTDGDMMKFLRWGRGASYHEFEIAIDKLSKLKVISSLTQFEKSALIKYGFKGVKYIKFLRSLKKDLPKGFCYPYLDIIIQK